MLDPHPPTDVARISTPPGIDDEVVQKPSTGAKKEKQRAGKEQQAAGKSAEREQKIRWDADNIRLKWIRLTIVMAGIGFGADRTLHELGQGGSASP